MSDSHGFSLALGTSFVVSTGLAIGYWIGVHELTPHDTCYGAPYNWAIFSKWYLLFSSILLLMILLLNNAWKHDYSKLKKTIIYLMFLPNLGTIAYVIGSFIAYHYRYECPAMHDLIVVSFWVSIFICLSPFIICSLLCLSGGVAAIKSCFGGHSHHHGHHHTTGTYQMAP